MNPPSHNYGAAGKINKIHSADSVNSVVDPYASETHKRIDAVLVVITLVLMIFAFRASAQHRATAINNANNPRAAQAQTNH